MVFFLSFAGLGLMTLADLIHRPGLCVLRLFDDLEYWTGESKRHVHAPTWGIVSPIPK